MMSEQSDAARNGQARADQKRTAALREVQRAIQEIEYGSVLIKIHQGEVVGIETSTKVRLAGS